jgi:transcriptional regulator GlxA family with amidase domain
MTRTVAFFVYPGFSLINLSGPASVFHATNYVLSMSGRKKPYTVELVSPSGGLVTSGDGVTVRTRGVARLSPNKVHTALFLGAHIEYLLPMKLDPSVRRWAARCASAATRFGAVCTGAFLLAPLGLLDV